MTERTARLALPLLAAGQAQKEVLHNEALAAIDLLVGATVEAAGINAPPLSPAEGQAWIVGPAPTGDWTGKAGQIAGWTAGGWRFAVAPEGMEAWSRAAGLRLRRTASGWGDGAVETIALRIGGMKVVGAQRPAIAAPSGGATVDAEARATLAIVLSALQSHGLIAS